MNKLFALIGVVTFIGTILFLIYKEGEQKGAVKEIKQNQEIELKVKNEIIKENKKIIKRKAISKSISNNDNFNWLLKNRCKDCSNE
jgi:hypothetical protein